jgi:hypothetical protein
MLNGTLKWRIECERVAKAQETNRLWSIFAHNRVAQQRFPVGIFEL